jgi:capsular polysaccharide biosynthesis protein
MACCQGLFARPRFDGRVVFSGLSVQKQMTSASRFIHDTYTSLQRRLKVALPLCQECPPSVKINELQPAGCCKLDTSLEAAFHGYLRQDVDYDWPEWCCYDIADAILTGDQGFVFLQDGRFFAPSLFPNHERVGLYKIRRPIRALARKFKGAVFHLTGPNHENRGHFMLDHLPRLLAARGLLSEIGDYQILLTGHHIRWQREHLRMLGFPDDRLIACDAGTLQVERLLHVRFASHQSSIAPPAKLHELRDCAGRYAEAEDQPAGPPVFLTRRDAPNRRLLNEERIFAAAKSLIPNLIEVKLTGMPLKEQIRLFRRTPLILSPLGQASCNIVFSKGCTILNLKHGPVPPDANGSIGTLIAAASGNRGLTIYSGTEMGQNFDWSYDESLFSGHLARFLEIEKQVGRLYR